MIIIIFVYSATSDNPLQVTQKAIAHYKTGRIISNIAISVDVRIIGSSKRSRFPATCHRIQMGAIILWIEYGSLIGVQEYG